MYLIFLFTLSGVKLIIFFSYFLKCFCIKYMWIKSVVPCSEIGLWLLIYLLLYKNNNKHPALLRIWITPKHHFMAIHQSKFTFGFSATVIRDNLPFNDRDTRRMQIFIFPEIRLEKIWNTNRTNLRGSIF